jgi:hypothetical protein
MQTHRRSFLPTLALVLLCGAPSSAGVLVVDGSGAPGTDFTSLQSAIDAAASGDVLLVRTGNYGGITVDGKGLTIVADEGATVNLGPDFLSESIVQNVPAGQTVALRGLHFDCFWPVSGGQLFVGNTLTVRDCAGAVWVEDCTVIQGRSSVRVVESADVTLVGCTLTGFGGGVNPGGAACEVAGATVSLVGCTLTGGQGQNAANSSFPPLLKPASPGGHGLSVQNASTAGAVTLMACTAQGGPGGNPFTNGLFCEGPKNGGDGVRVGDFGGATPVVRHVDSVLLGGAAGAPIECTTPANPGVPLSVTSGIAFEMAGQTPLLTSATPTREGGAVSLTIDGQAGDSALLLVSALPGGAFVFSKHGDLLLGGAVLVIPLAALPVSGQLSLTATLPELGPGLEGVVVYVQAATCAAGDCTLGSGTALVLLDAAL